MAQSDMTLRYYRRVIILFFAFLFMGFAITSNSFAGDGANAIANTLNKSSNMVMKQFYNQRGNQPAWVSNSGLTPQGEQAVGLLRQASGTSPATAAAWDAFEQQVNAGNITPDQIAQLDQLITGQVGSLLGNNASSANLDDWMSQLTDMASNPQFSSNLGDYQQAAEKALAEFERSLNAQGTGSFMDKAKRWMESAMTKIKAMVAKMRT